MVKMNNKNMRSGAVLLVVLFVCMVVAIISLGVLARASREMACGDSTSLRLKMDYLAEAGLVHAKTLLLNPQEVSTSPDGYWQGDPNTPLQMQAGDDYYKLTVTRSSSGATSRCTYDIDCLAYRQKGAESTIQSTLYAQLRLDPCIAYWAGDADTSLSAKATVNGDVYCKANLTSSAVVNGDVFATSFTGTSAGQSYAAGALQVVFPDITTDFFSPTYRYGELSYSPVSLAAEDCNNPPAFEPDAGSNPAGVVYRLGNLRLMGNVAIDGTLVVNGNLTIQGPGATVITASKNYPAIIVNGSLTVEDAATVSIEGLVCAHSMTVAADADNITILGALFLKDTGIIQGALYSGDIAITTAPMISSVNLISASIPDIKWSPAGDAFFKYIRRTPSP